MDATAFREWITEATRLVEENADHLTHLDAAIGDADHGINLRRGFQAAVAAYQGVVDAGGGLPDATRAAADAAARGLAATVDMQARKGRASYLGPRTVGHEDPGAASTVLILRALATVTEKP